MDLDPAARRAARFGTTLVPAAYAVILVAVLLGACLVSLRAYGIFRCQASGYGPDRYLGYCGATGYGDYDHGAFWFNLEPAAVQAAKRARILFLGNSRMQFGFSAQATNDWFAAHQASYYLLGFSHNGNSLFEAPLLHKLQPAAAVYVVNIDLFFEPAESPPARVVMREAGARNRYRDKQGWQRIHKPLCRKVPLACGNAMAFFRAPTTGAWVVAGRGFQGAPVSYSQAPDSATVETYTSRGREFLGQLGVPRKCVIMTMVPTVDTPIRTAEAVARNLDVALVAPELEGLQTFDASHLDAQSAERWSHAFLEAAGPRIGECLGTARSRSPLGATS